MKRNPLAVALSVLIILIAAFHIIATRYNLYFSIPWFDSLLHLLGGFWAGLFSIYYIFGFVKPSGEIKTAKIFLVGIISALFIGAIWEIYEYKFGFTFTTKSSYALDTFSDLVMDTVGAIAASFYVSRRKQFLNFSQQ